MLLVGTKLRTTLTALWFSLPFGHDVTLAAFRAPITRDELPIFWCVHCKTENQARFGEGANFAFEKKVSGEPRVVNQVFT